MAKQDKKKAKAVPKAAPAPKKKPPAPAKAAAAPAKAAPSTAAGSKKGAQASPAPESKAKASFPIPAMGSVVGAILGHDRDALGMALAGVDFDRTARHLLSWDWKQGHFASMDWKSFLYPIGGPALDSLHEAVTAAWSKGEVKLLAKALRSADWKKIAAKAPMDSLIWAGQALEIAVALYNHEKTEIVCKACPYEHRDVFARLYRLEREVSGRVVPLLCAYEGTRQHCPPDLAADSWTRIDDLTGQDGRSVRSDGLADRCVSPSKIGFDISDVPEGGGCVVMKDWERARVHVQRAGRVPSEQATADGRIAVQISGFKSTDVVQVVASGWHVRGDGPRKHAVVEWETNATNSEITFTVYAEDGSPISSPEDLVTIDWIATTR